jgi:hypothetical protein
VGRLIKGARNGDAIDDRRNENAYVQSKLDAQNECKCMVMCM